MTEPWGPPSSIISNGFGFGALLEDASLCKQEAWFSSVTMWKTQHPLGSKEMPVLWKSQSGTLSQDLRWKKTASTKWTEPWILLTFPSMLSYDISLDVSPRTLSKLSFFVDIFTEVNLLSSHVCGDTYTNKNECITFNIILTMYILLWKTHTGVLFSQGSGLSSLLEMCVPLSSPTLGESTQSRSSGSHGNSLLVPVVVSPQPWS